MIEPPWLDRSAYPFAHNTIDLSAGRMHYVDEGTGPPILLVHGTPTWSFEYRHLIRSLAARWRTIAPDHLGFGLSSRPTSFPYTPEAHASILREFVERLGLVRFALVVHDFGGPIGLPLCFDPRFEVTHLVLLNTWMWPINDDTRTTLGIRLLAGPFGRLLYKYANASLRLLMPTAYGDRSKLTPSIHRQYLGPFGRRKDRVLVLHAHYLGHEGSGARRAEHGAMAEAPAERPPGYTRPRRPLAASGGTRGGRDDYSHLSRPRCRRRTVCWRATDRLVRQPHGTISDWAPA